jgi:hypothetical protein
MQNRPSALLSISVFLLLAGCGGSTAQGQGAPTGTDASGDVTSDATDEAPGCTDPLHPPYCAGVAVGLFNGAICGATQSPASCVGGQWTCPDGTVSPDKCLCAVDGPQVNAGCACINGMLQCTDAGSPCQCVDPTDIGCPPSDGGPGLSTQCAPGDVCC